MLLHRTTASIALPADPLPHRLGEGVGTMPLFLSVHYSDEYGGIDIT